MLIFDITRPKLNCGQTRLVLNSVGPVAEEQLATKVSAEAMPLNIKTDNREKQYFANRPIRFLTNLPQTACFSFLDRPDRTEKLCRSPCKQVSIPLEQRTKGLTGSYDKALHKLCKNIPFPC